MGITSKLFMAIFLFGGLDSPATDQVSGSEGRDIESAEQLNEIVVTRTKGSTSKRLEPVEYLRRFCFEPNRLVGQSAPPVDSADWDPLDPLARKQFGIFDEAVQAFGLTDEDRNRTLLIKFQQVKLGDNLIENRCTLVVIGGEGHESFSRDMSAMFRGAGTQRHTGHRDGVDQVDGWRQFLWTGMPSRGSKNWQSINSGRRGGQPPTWVVVANRSFYQRHEYIAGELKISEDGEKPLSVITFSHIKKIQ